MFAQSRGQSFTIDTAANLEGMNAAMATLLRIQHARARHHVISRGDRREVLQEGLRAAGLKAQELHRLRGSDRRKVAIARAISEQTLVPQKWLAERLVMKSPANVSQQLRRFGIDGKRSDLPLSLRSWLFFVKI